MGPTICNNCRLALRRTLRASRPSRPQSTTAAAAAATTAVPASLTRPSRTSPSSSSSSSSPSPPPSPSAATLLSRPTWSVRSLLPPASEPSTTTIPPSTLHHLLRLSALPQPTTPTEESQMLATLSSQLHFVRAIQGVDTTDIPPLRVIRDETSAGLRAQTIGLAELAEALQAEDVVGHARRPRRRRGGREAGSSDKGGEGGDTDSAREQGQGQEQVRNEAEDWDVLGSASETARGRYFVVRSGGTGSLPSGTVG
ncbi:hypothetical protein F4859DRAFT_382180 [Xylaria cf. heliscus]|nr:hypothetical protein F4859DRAFT_382180 [Xylaria cf. heliscus]